MLLDIEGTTTPISFVHDVLFPYARTHMREFLHAQAESAQVHETACMLRDERAATLPDGGSLPLWKDETSSELLDSVAEFCDWLMDRDVKSPGLKRLQGIIWEKGYADGTLIGEVFPDVPPALERWRKAGIVLAIYSSGSVLAQRLIFSHTKYGDLTRYISAFFDTAVGAKKTSASYGAIASELQVPPLEILFLSDVDAELIAAADASCQIALCVRPGNAPVRTALDASTISSFDEIVV